jgi:hypothetical protein
MPSSRKGRFQVPFSTETVIEWIRISHGALARAYQAIVGISIAANSEEAARAAKRCMELLKEIEIENEKIVRALR